MSPRRAIHPKPGPRQEAFDFTGEHHMPQTFEEYAQLAAEGAVSRRMRRDELHLPEHTRGVRQRVGDRFIPRSGGERTTLARLPEVQIIYVRYHAKERVREKYRETDVNPMRVQQWANFSAARAVAVARGKFWSYRIDARKQRVPLTRAISSEGTVTTDAIRETEETATGIRDYLIDLRSFRDKKWIQARWTNKLEEAREWADGYMSRLVNEQLLTFYKEALGNAWSREQFWTAVEDRYQEYQRQINEQDPGKLPSWQIPPAIHDAALEAMGFEPYDEQSTIPSLGRLSLGIDDEHI